VYNKGSPLEEKIFNEIPLPNVGREGHTYYTYIYENYDNLDDYTVFLQGNPFDHTPNIIENLHLYKNLIVDQDFIELSTIIVDDDLSRGHGPMIDVYEKLFGEKKTSFPFVFGAGAQFIVSKKIILSRPKDFYHKIIRLLDYDIHPMEGFVIKRLHSMIFSYNH